MGGVEEWSDVEGGEEEPQTPQVSEEETEDGDLTPGRERKGRKGLSQGEPDADATAKTTRERDEEPGEKEVEEGREAVKTRKVIEVSPEEREKHELTHCPFRSWCKFCVMGRAHKAPHQRTPSGEKNPGVPRVSMDYFYMSQKDEEATEFPMIVMVNESTGDKFARMTGVKGIGQVGTQDWLLMEASECLKTWGHTGGDGTKLILKSDGERSIMAFRNALGKLHGGVVIPEESAKNESQSNGTAEEAGRTVREFIRVLKFQMEEGAQMKLKGDENILQWLTRWAALVCSKYLVGKDGRTASERRRGRRCKVPAVPFGETVFYRQVREGKAQKDKGETEISEGIWLGHADRSNEMLIGTDAGVIRVFDVIRKPKEERWSKDKITNMTGTPRQPDPKKPGGKIPVRVTFEETEEKSPVQSRQKEVEFRRLRITPDMLKKHGYTQGCEGCKHKQAGMSTTRPHTEKCRRRLVEELAKTVEGQRMIEREDERVARRMDEISKEQEKETEDVQVLALRAIREIENKVDTGVDVAEIYSPARVTEAAVKIGLKAGLAMDLTNGWDFRRKEHREAAEKYIR